VPITIGLEANYPQLLAIVFLGSLFTSLLGATVAVFFDNFTQFLVPGMAVLFAIGLPQVAYMIPSFAPPWLRWLPTYPFAFGLREAILPSGNPEIVVSALLTLGVLTIVTLGLASAAFQRQVAHH
jgi:ABC-type polysaccharide/polyol phosphate export permease